MQDVALVIKIKQNKNAYDERKSLFFFFFLSLATLLWKLCHETCLLLHSICRRRILFLLWIDLSRFFLRSIMSAVSVSSTFNFSGMAISSISLRGSTGTAFLFLLAFSSAAATMAAADVHTGRGRPDGHSEVLRVESVELNAPSMLRLFTKLSWVPLALRSV